MEPPEAATGGGRQGLLDVDGLTGPFSPTNQERERERESGGRERLGELWLSVDVRDVLAWLALWPWAQHTVVIKSTVVDMYSTRRAMSVDSGERCAAAWYANDLISD